MATVGDTSAPSTDTIYYDDLLSTTLNNYVGGGTLFDNIFKDSALLTWLRRQKAVVYLDGGDRISMPLMYGKNETIGSIDSFDVIDTTPQDGITTAFAEWRELAGTISISRKDQRKNSSESRILSLLESKIKQAEMTMTEKLNEQLITGTVSGGTFVPGNGAKDLNPLLYFLRKDNTADPSSGGNVGNIAASNSWWRHNTAILDTGSAETGHAFAMAVSSYAGLKAALHRMYNFCGRGSGGSPDLVLTDQVSYETYENALDQQVRYTVQDMADMGFETVKCKGAAMIWDEQVPDLEAGTVEITKGTAIFINTKFYKLVIDKETDIVTTPFVSPENQNAKSAKILFMGNACVSNLRKHGVCYAIDQTITS